MSYANNRPRVYLFDLGSGHQSLLGDFAGMTFAPRFSPDGGSVIMSVTSGGGSDIVVVDLASRASRRLTDSGAIDVSPCYSPDGTQIVFNSDRDGDQQLYVMGAGGGGAKRISFGHGALRDAGLVAARRSDRLHAVWRRGGNFAIGVMHPDGSGERILSESFSVEGPTFAPNGRVIDVLARDGGARQPRLQGFRPGWCRSTSPGSTSAWCRRRPMPRTRPGRRWPHRNLYRPGRGVDVPGRGENFRLICMGACQSGVRANLTGCVATS